jgi:hypothetical protein
MNKSRAGRAIGLGVLVTLAVLCTSWVLERASGTARPPDAGAVSEPSRPSSPRPGGDQEFDRSDILLSLG